ncbi:MAG: hypothetical protein ABW175_21095 [Bradyrhizobium sp.]
MSIRHTLFLSFLLASAATVVEAQAPPSPATPPQATAPAPNQNAACAPTDTSGMPAADGVTTGRSSEPLGDKLAKSGGVLCPPSTADSEIHAPTPEGGNTPVIPPPGSPGGNPNVVPK